MDQREPGYGIPQSGSHRPRGYQQSSPYDEPDWDDGEEVDGYLVWGDAET